MPSPRTNYPSPSPIVGSAPRSVRPKELNMRAIAIVYVAANTGVLGIFATLLMSGHIAP